MDLSIIKEVRKVKGLSQQELGERLGVSGAYIQQIESNKKNPSMKTLQRIAKALEITLGELVGVETNLFIKNDSVEARIIDKVINDEHSSEKEKQSMMNNIFKATEFNFTKRILEGFGYKLDFSCSPCIIIKNIKSNEDIAQMDFDDFEKFSVTLNITNHAIVMKMISDYKLITDNEKTNSAKTSHEESKDYLIKNGLLKEIDNSLKLIQEENIKSVCKVGIPKGMHRFKKEGE